MSVLSGIVSQVIPVSERDWRESAYLRVEDWPEAIPGMGPRREYGPYPWGESYDEYSEYPSSHPDAASVGGRFMGDVCPECGVPLAFDETVLNEHGTKGDLASVSPNENPVACWHPECWRDRESRKARAENRTLAGYA